MASVTLKGVQKRYGKQGSYAVRELDLEVGESEFLCLLGPSGCGKTTTLRMIAGLENLTAGEIRLGDRVVESVGDAVFVPPEKRDLGLVFQSYALWPHLTVLKNIEFGLRLRKMPAEERQAKCLEVMTKLGIEQYGDRYPSELSGGEQQRVALARMLVINPRVVLLDEPLSNLDAKLRLEMRNELKRIHQEFGSTVIFVTHDQWEAMTLASRIVVMSKGLLQQAGTPTEIYERPANRFVAEFLGTLPINVIEIDTESPEPVALRFLRFLSTNFPELGRPGAVAIRPEAVRVEKHLRDVPRGVFSSEARVLDIVPTGGNWIVEVAAAQRKLLALVDSLPTVRPGEDATIWVPASNVHFFDHEGDRITEADAMIASKGLVGS